MASTGVCGLTPLALGRYFNASAARAVAAIGWRGGTPPPLRAIPADGAPMIRSELVDCVAERNPHLTRREADRIVGAILDSIVDALADGRRVELRGFGAFTARGREARAGRNPRTGDTVEVAGKRVPHFRAGKEMRHRLNIEPDS